MVVSKTYSRKNARSLIKYLLDEKPHTTELVQQRNLLVTGQSIYQIADPYHPKDPLQWDSNLVAGQFGASRSHAKNPDKKIQAYHMIVSFSDQEFPPEGNQKQEAKQATQLVKGFLGKYFPENAQDLITIQRDGRGGKLHVHIAVNSLLTSGKCIRTNLMTQMETLNENVESALKSLTDVQKQLLNVTDSLLGKPELTASDSKSTHTGSKTELPTGGTLSSLIASLETLSDYLESLPSKDQLGLLTQNLGQLLQRIDEVQK